MTPDEAAKKWCPFVRLGYGQRDLTGVVPATAPPMNRIQVGAEFSMLPGMTCIAGNCAMWVDDPSHTDGRGNCAFKVAATPFGHVATFN